MVWPWSQGGHPSPPRSLRHGGGRRGCGLSWEASQETREMDTGPPPSLSPSTPSLGTREQTSQRFLLTKQRSAASKLLLRAGQEKWVFNRQGRRAWQSATAAGEINKQKS